ncbi:3-keto-disaccharide hydrolase [Acidicapsa acidisoli]|uniref:3-keto-disaccharide hydrolase n=1 Tax=Acidicapsa acidisoli TaxID=1615681 RepID=UPI0021E0A9CE|nr:DUF1080 domain-containing protein [Acidicapsa acidisoli]
MKTSTLHSSSIPNTSPRLLRSSLASLIVLAILAMLGVVPARAQAQSPAGASGQPSQSAPKTDSTPAKNPPASPKGALRGSFHEPDPIDWEDHDGYQQIFDGVSLKNWVGDPAVWRVEDGAIVGESTKEKPVTNSYISFHGFEAKDFDLKLEIKVVNGGGSGIQYRSQTGITWRRAPADQQPNLDWMMTGPQADFWSPAFPIASEWTGQFYSENTPLGILAWRGQVVDSSPGKDSRLVGNIGDRTPLGGYVKVNDWNQYLIMARGGTFIHILNGQLMAVYVDDDPDSSNNKSGMIGIEIEGSPSKVLVRNIWIKKLR